MISGTALGCPIILQYLGNFLKKRNNILCFDKFCKDFVVSCLRRVQPLVPQTYSDHSGIILSPQLGAGQQAQRQLPR